MLKEELIQAFKHDYQKINGICKDVDDMAVEFVNSLPIPLDNIKMICDMDEWDYDDETCYIDITIESKCNKSTCVMYFKYKRKNIITLKPDFEYALNRWYCWSGVAKHSHAYLKDNVVLLHFEDEDLDIPLYQYLRECRVTILSTMLDASKDLWDKLNCQRWYEYSTYILPILKAIDYIENRFKPYKEE